MKKRSFQKMIWEQLEIPTHAHTDIDPLLSLYRKNNKKWFTDLNVKSKTIKLVLENMRESLWILGLGKDFFGYYFKRTINKKQTDKLYSTNIKNTCSSKRYC